MRIRSMTRVTGAAALAALLGAPAFAADYPVLRGSQIEDTPQAPTLFANSFNWTGFYIGGGAGVSDTKFKPENTFATAPLFAFNNTTLGRQVGISTLINVVPEKNDSGATYFGFMGYNVAFGDAVLGIEADYTRSGQSYDSTGFISSGFAVLNGAAQSYELYSRQAAKIDDYATARLRMGWAFGSIMPFATIGGAVGRFNTASRVYAIDSVSRLDLTPTSGPVIKKNTYGFGLAVGAGVDWALADNIFLRGEYQLIRFADVESTTTTINTARAAVGVKF